MIRFARLELKLTIPSDKAETRLGSPCKATCIFAESCLLQVLAGLDLCGHA